MRISDYEKKIRRRNLVEYLAGTLIIVAFGWSAWRASAAGEWFVSGSVVALIAGVLLVMFNLHRRASNVERAPEVDCKEHRRAQLIHQRSALRTVAVWYIGPMVPGIFLVMLSTAAVMARETGWMAALADRIFPILAVTIVFGGVIWLNRNAARRLTKEIDELDSVGDTI